MSVLSGKELRIVGFLCNWCSYGGADTAGTARATQPTDLRIIRVPCSGRVNPLFVLKALMNGADGVLVSGCHPATAIIPPQLLCPPPSGNPQGVPAHRGY